VEGSIYGPATSKQATTHVHNVGSSKKANGGTSKDTTRKEELTKGYEKAKLHEVVVYISRVMRKNQHKDSIKCA
jgi:hypothetical protein